MLNRGGSDNEDAVGHRVSQGCELLRIREHTGGRANGGTGFTKRRPKRTHHAQMQYAEVAHGSGSRAQVERVSRSDQDDAQPVEK